MPVSPEWVSIVAPFVSGAFGVGVAYGFIRSQITTLKERMDKADTHIDKQVGETRCQEYRALCRAEWKEDIRRVEGK